MAFIGQFKHSVDEKGRLAIPAKFRVDLKQGAVVTVGLDSCLFLYTAGEWNKAAEKYASLPINRADDRAFSRHMFAGAMEVEFDKQGRALIPEYLRKFAGIKKNVVIAGVLNRLEIWDEERWSAYKNQTEAEIGSIAERMAALGV